MIELIEDDLEFANGGAAPLLLAAWAVAKWGGGVTLTLGGIYLAGESIGSELMRES